MPVGAFLQRLRRLAGIGWGLHRNLGLFLRSARTDTALRKAHGTRAAFEQAYGNQPDPWASADLRYTYQSQKYDGIMARLPVGRRFVSALDLGCGLGLLSLRLAACADAVLGVDLAQAALDLAAIRTASFPSVSYLQGDVADLPATLDGRFDLVVIADTVYYLPRPITDLQLAALATSVARLLVPGGLCLLANHYFFAADPDSRLTRRIHRAFGADKALTVVSTARRPFYIVDLLAVR